MALLLSQQGKTGQAIDAYRQALRINPYDCKLCQEYEQLLASRRK
jgi:hypothetical protein